MNKLFGLLLLCLMPGLVGWSFISEVPAPSGGTEPNTFVGNETPTSVVAPTNYNRCSLFSATNDLTVSYGYWFGRGYDDVNDTFEMYVFTSDAGALGVQVGTCSNPAQAGSLPNAWREVVFPTPFTLTGGTDYFICFSPNSNDGLYYEYEDSTGTNFYNGVSLCGEEPTTSSARQVVMGVANYHAH